MKVIACVEVWVVSITRVGISSPNLTFPTGPKSEHQDKDHERMCGIIGVFSRRGPVSPAVLMLMIPGLRQKARHAGTEAQAICEEKSAILSRATTR